MANHTPLHRPLGLSHENKSFLLIFGGYSVYAEPPVDGAKTESHECVTEPFEIFISKESHAASFWVFQYPDLLMRERRVQKRQMNLNRRGYQLNSGASVDDGVHTANVKIGE